MSAETLRRAAALMRERAEAAAENVTGDPFGVRVDRAVTNRMWRPHAELACSWTPAATLAVAEWLDAQAERAEIGFSDKVYEHALTVARTYLRESA